MEDENIVEKAVSLVFGGIFALFALLAASFLQLALHNIFGWTSKTERFPFLLTLFLVSIVYAYIFSFNNNTNRIGRVLHALSAGFWMSIMAFVLKGIVEWLQVWMTNDDLDVTNVRVPYWAAHFLIWTVYAHEWVGLRKRRKRSDI